MAGKSLKRLRKTPNGNIGAVTVESDGIDRAPESDNRADVGHASEPGQVVDSGESVINPADLDGTGSDSDSGQPRRGRGRPTGSRNKKQQPRSASGNQENIELLLLSIHSMGASLLRIPELEIQEDEAKLLASKIEAVNALYDIPILSPAVAAWMGLVTAAGTVYGPRFVAVKMRQARQKKDQPITIDAVEIR